MTKKEVEAIQPEPFKPKMSYTRFKNGLPIPEEHPFYTPPREQKEWSPQGTHDFKLPDGTVEQRPGRYVTKMTRGGK